MGATAVAFVIIVVVCCIRMSNGTAAWPRAPPSISVTGYFRGFGTIMFSYGGAAMFPTIQNDMKQRSRFPLAVAYATIALVALYVVMAILGYLTFGNSVNPNILTSIGDGPVSIAVQLLFIVHLVTGFLIIINPMCQEVEEHIGVPTEFTWKRVVMRATIMVALLLTTETVPHFGKVLPLVGSFMVGLTTFILPCVFYYKLCSDTSPEWKDRVCKNRLCILNEHGAIGSLNSQDEKIVVLQARSVTAPSSRYEHMCRRRGPTMRWRTPAGFRSGCFQGLQHNRALRGLVLCSRRQPKCVSFGSVVFAKRGYPVAVAAPKCEARCFISTLVRSTPA
ncbi:hypothetical protein V5799_023323 [Amblyomma americanum]|uniref:Amino acid transporter transmembrane domain-containing protein n=1 Tax=Amblyomma americanum TaxID=6943 RepID=A0AAQ4FI96_AMBAM